MSVPKPDEETSSVASNDLVSFDFISSEDLKKSLQSDYAELTKAVSENMHKSVCILAGSIAEAVLMDYITVTSNCGVAVDDLTASNVGLTKLIDAAIGADVVTSKQLPAGGWGLPELLREGEQARRSCNIGTLRNVYLMSSAVASFRNLIHPGRALRLRERVDRNLALAARAFVLQLCNDMSQESSMHYPYMAEDIMKKAELDSNARTILANMLSKTRPSEVTRLLVEVAPRAFLENLRQPGADFDKMFPDHIIDDDETAREYKFLCRSAAVRQAGDSIAYRLAFDRGTPEQKSAGVHAIAELLKTEDPFAVAEIETAFLHVGDLKCANEDDQSLVAGDILDRICSSDASKGILEAATGIGRWIPPEGGERFAQALLGKRFGPRVDAEIRRSAFSLLENEYGNMHATTQDVIRRATSEYRDVMKASSWDNGGDVQVIEDLIAYWDNPPCPDDFDDTPPSPSS